MTTFKKTKIADLLQIQYYYRIYFFNVYVIKRNKVNWLIGLYHIKLTESDFLYVSDGLTN